MGRGNRGELEPLACASPDKQGTREARRSEGASPTPDSSAGQVGDLGWGRGAWAGPKASLLPQWVPWNRPPEPGILSPLPSVAPRDRFLSPLQTRLLAQAGPSTKALEVLAPEFKRKQAAGLHRRFADALL